MFLPSSVQEKLHRALLLPLRFADASAPLVSLCREGGWEGPEIGLIAVKGPEIGLDASLPVSLCFCLAAQAGETAKALPSQTLFVPQTLIFCNQKPCCVVEMMLLLHLFYFAVSCV